ncbi:hypothetical protein HZZ00_37510 (plasmid) [Streptomyces sp. NEAU-sy36]|uniref:hypothetical protein n=1 Tax=unclassified Streptomyces TaxID=2593676 RepID=UPI0015D62ABC|nr:MULTISPECIES: hypothetical protein [unclassified Streptomyces]QLJ06734.1 hypothetical protein HZZ00_37510 [Streptomyces sp. NEAU-sy36]
MTTSAQQQTDQRSELTALITAATLDLVRQWERLPTAQDTLLRALERLRPGLGATTRINAHITAFNQQVGEFSRLTHALIERWAAHDLPTAYRDGALRALRQTDADLALFRWTADHQAAITALTAAFYTDLVGRIQEAVRRAQAFARAAQDATREVTMGRNHAGIDSAALIRDHPLSTIIYRDSSRHPVKDWARSALTYQGAVTANHGAINTGRLDLEAQWFECVDGSECGFTSHQDTDHANGTIRSADDAAAYPIAHFGCIRQWTPRPDLNGASNLVSGDPA